MQLQDIQVNHQSIALTALKVSQQVMSGIRVEAYMDKLHELTLQCHRFLEGAENEQQRFERLLDAFYSELAFSGNEHDYLSSQNCLMDYVIGFRTGMPVSLAIVFLHMADYFQIEVKGVKFPGHFLLRFDVDEDRALFIDPLNGEPMNWHQMDARFRGEKGDLAELSPDDLESVSRAEIIIQLLYEMKSAFIREKQYELALYCIDQIVEVSPEDPYERRDRGLILHQLDCFESAKSDYEFFIDQCPDDPTAKMLKLQLREIASKTEVFH